MNIRQITSKVVCGEKNVGKWYCSDSKTGSDNHPVHRYLQHDGTWGKNTQYFDSKQEIENALAKGHKPDFNIAKQELHDRETIRQDVEHMMNDDYFTDY